MSHIESEVLLKKVAALQAERDAALADNAALLERLGEVSTILEAKELRHYGPDDVNLAAKMRRVIDAAWVLVRAMSAQPHPGAALLEKHAKALASERGARLAAERALAEERARTAAWVSNVREVEIALGMDTSSGMTISDAHRVLVRARNEGLEKAAKRFDDRAAALREQAKAAVPLRARDVRTAALFDVDDAKAIRALKEPDHG